MKKNRLFISVCSLILIFTLSLGAVSVFAIDDVHNESQLQDIGFFTYIGTYDTYHYDDNGKRRNLYYYRDFAVAQHSSFYHAWTSSETNSWEVPT